MMNTTDFKKYLPWVFYAVAAYIVLTLVFHVHHVVMFHKIQHGNQDHAAHNGHPAAHNGHKKYRD